MTPIKLKIFNVFPQTNYSRYVNRRNYSRQNIADKFTKLNKACFSMEKLRADFLNFPIASVKILVLGVTLVISV